MMKNRDILLPINAGMILLLAALTLLGSCRKFLEAKPDSKLAIPATVSDLQALLDARGINTLYPTAGDIASDDYYLSNDDYNAITTPDLRNDYIYEGSGANDQDYQYLYQYVNSANIVLDNIDQVSSPGQNETNNVKGQAYFFRGYTQWHLASVFAMPYRENSDDPGIPLKLRADLSAKTTRSTMNETYGQILSDLKEAARLLPVTPLVKTRPTKPAAFGVLARVYLIMGNYEAAGKYADSCLQLANTLIDYNTVNATAAVPFTRYHAEVIFHSTSSGRGSVTSLTRARVDSNLYASYAANDLRKKVFFKAGTAGSQLFKGDYGGGTAASLFGGIATDEQLLIRAECYARMNKVAEAVADLNLLLINRWQKGTFTPYPNTLSATDLLTIILTERRKELLLRNELRWTDIRRLNNTAEHQKTLTRKVGSNTYTLAPGSKKFAYLLPEIVIQISGIPQNAR